MQELIIRRVLTKVVVTVHRGILFISGFYSLLLREISTYLKQIVGLLIKITLMFDNYCRITDYFKAHSTPHKL